jgi:hypothetical protein
MWYSIIFYFRVCALAVAVWTPAADSNRLVFSGHAHNDYQHPRPLWEAIGYKFISIEADIYLVGQDLLVGHDKEDLNEDRSLQSLYLEPLRLYINDRDGWVYPGHELILLIDIKSAAEPTYEILRKELTAYSDILTSYSSDHVERRAVAVVISGNRPREFMRNEEIRYATYDGRLEDLSGEKVENFMILISDNWQSHFSWRGEGPMPAAEREKLSGIIAGAHAKGYKIRFWNLPADDPACRRTIWTELISAGVDLISVDDLKAYHDFLIDEMIQNR